LIYVLSETAEQTAKTEDGVGEEKTGFTPEDIGEFAVERLERG